MSIHPRERLIVGVLAAIQFINVLDFMMVMPLGPDFSEALGFPSSSVGIVAAAYTGAASVAGVAGSFFLDRFDRKRALMVSVAGLAVCTLVCALAWDLTTLVVARVLAGLFGGPTASLSLSVVADVVPPERRGKAMGTVMGSFAVASVAGVPFGLELAHLAAWPGRLSAWFGLETGLVLANDWRVPFHVVALLGLVVVALVGFMLPSLRMHLEARPVRSTRIWDLFVRRLPLLTYAGVACMLFSAFIVIPNIAPYIQQNLGYSRDKMGLLYMLGGVASLLVLQIFGRLVDRFGSAPVSALAFVLLCVVQVLWFIAFPASGGTVLVFVLFVAFMCVMSMRGVAFNALTSKVPEAHERASYQSAQSAVQHFAAALGGWVASLILFEAPDKTLGGMATVAWISLGLSALVPLLVWRVERGVNRRGMERELANAAGSS